MKRKTYALSRGVKRFIRFSEMKILFVLFFAFEIQAMPCLQSGGLNLDLRNATLKEAINEIRKQSDFSFVYSDVDLREVARRDIRLKDAGVDDVLRIYLEGTDLRYEVADKTIIIRKLPVSSEQEREKTIRGIVVDPQNRPLPGVTVVIKGTQSGVSTDSEGNFRLKLPRENKETVLVFSFIGMKSVEVKYAGQKDIRVKMEAEISEMEEVVVTGIFEKSKESFTGSVSVITEKELKSFRGRNLLTTLKNVDPTFNLIGNNIYGSDPNHLPEVQIRGTSSLPTVEELKNETKVNLNTPLIIMDGFEISLSRMLDMNEENVVSVTILKDGSATALYGSRGANGVIIIETKKPQAGRIYLSYRGNVNIEVPDLSDYDVLNAAEKLQLEADAGMYFDKWSHFEMELRERYTRILEEIERGVDTYWLAKPLRTGIGHRHNLRLEGGGEEGFRYSASLHYNDILGVMKGSDRKSFNGSSDMLYTYKTLSLRNNLEIGLGESNNSPYGSFADYVVLNPYWRGYDKDGKVLKELEERNYFWNVAPSNPLYNATLDLVDKNTHTSITDRFDLEWHPVEELTLRARIGIVKTVRDYDNFKPADHTDFKDYSEKEIFRKGKYVYSSGKDFRYDWDATLSYFKVFGRKHELYAGLNYSMAQDRQHTYTFSAEGFPYSNIKFLSMALQYEKDKKPSGTESVNRRIGLTGNINYNYDNLYFADIAYRVDGASQFGSSRRFAPFYSFGLGWNIHREKFLTGADWLDRLKLRASYALTGAVNFNPYQALGMYEYYTNDRYRHWFGSHLMGLANEDLKWQNTTKWNLGIELSVLNNRLKLITDIYRDKTNNLLSEMDLALANGFPSYTANVGEVGNKGVEMSLSAYILRDTERNTIWSVSASFIYEKNEILKISDALKQANEELERRGGQNPHFMYREGEALRTIYVVPSLGIDPSTGRELFEDRFGNVTYTWDARDKKAFGVEDPKYRGNINTMFTCRNWSLNLSFGYRLGGYKYNATLVGRVENADLKYNVDRRVYRDRWIRPGDHTFFKDVRDKRPTFMSSRFVQKENALECQSLQLKYDFDSSLTNRILGCRNLSLMFNTDNLFHISSVKQERGIMYPFSRRFAFSFSAIF